MYNGFGIVDSSTHKRWYRTLGISNSWTLVPNFHGTLKGQEEVAYRE